MAVCSFPSAFTYRTRTEEEEEEDVSEEQLQLQEVLSEKCSSSRRTGDRAAPAPTQKKDGDSRETLNFTRTGPEVLEVLRLDLSGSDLLVQNLHGSWTGLR